MAEQFSELDVSQIGAVLNAEPHPQQDVAHGAGQALAVGETVLEVYPAAGVARVTTADARIELFRVPTYSIAGERVVFEQGLEDNQSRLQVRADGKVAFHPVLRAAEPSRTADAGTGGRQDSPASSDASERSTAAPRDAEPVEVPEQQLRGRLGRDPWYNDTGDQPIGGFPLAVNDEQGGGTTWHRVVVFDATAQQLHAEHGKGQIKKGRLVDVTGSPVVREEPRAGGGVRKSPEFHASAVVRVQSRPTR